MSAATLKETLVVPHRHAGRQMIVCIGWGSLLWKPRELPLSGQELRRAEEYVRKAPEQTRTRYRERIERELGWVAEKKGDDT